MSFFQPHSHLYATGHFLEESIEQFHQALLLFERPKKIPHLLPC